MLDGQTSRLRTARRYVTRLHHARPRHLRRLVPHPAPDQPSAPQVGIVERFGTGRVSGWIVVARGVPPVRVALYVNDTEITASWATGVSDRSDRNSWSEVRSFRFHLKDVWDYVRPTDRLTVRADGVVLPITGAGMFFSPPRRGPHSPRRLRHLLDEGYVFEQYGKLSLSKQRDVEWQQQVMGLFAEIRAFIQQRFGYELFFIYGTLLGAVRENGFIGHDIDLDAGYLSRHHDGPDVTNEVRDVAISLIDAGYEIESFRTHLHITRADGTRIDLFHMFFNNRHRLSLPFGIAGTSEIHSREWQGVREIAFSGATGAVPVIGEKLVAHLYGDDWRRPKPGFHWPQDRTARATAGVLPEHLHEEIYWANFYAHTEYETGSTFQTFIESRDDTPASIIDIGCGDGRDSFAFGQNGRRVLGLDKSSVGIAHAAKKAMRSGLDAVRFRAVDVAQSEQLRAILRAELEAVGAAPAMLYLRFFLHSIPEDTQLALMEVIKAEARTGDILAAEFRTTQDEQLAKVHTRHYRRYQDGPAFGDQLRTTYGFDVLFETSGRGLSPYGDEDPELYRVVARRRAGD